MFCLDDTIAAISTALGEGGIGIVRLTGPEALPILRSLFLTRSAPDPAPGSTLPGWYPQPYRLHYGQIVDPSSGLAVDEVLAVHMPAPATYTRQDIVEINGHGGIVALQQILALCLRQGARPAEPGEFTARAFLNGRIDLAQAEAVLDVVRAKTSRSLQAALAQLDGRLSGQVRSVRETLVDALAQLEAGIDFPEDEIPERDIGPDLEQAGRCLERLLADADRGIIYRQGVRAAIVGRPNVGKSSLLNCLLRSSRAIVTDIPGTTRDTLEETLNLQGVPIVLVDTAGITAAQDLIEKLGVERSRAALEQADLALLVVDASQTPGEADRAMAALIGGRPALLVLNKIDLVACPDAGWSGILEAAGLPVSALTGQGIPELEKAIVATVLSGQVNASALPLVTNPRHKALLSRALDQVRVAHTGHEAGLTADLVAIDLAAAVQTLGEITGQTAGEDLLDAVFGNFCIGK